jgi:two-component system nitrogen regulation response regulator GlnG
VKKNILVADDDASIRFVISKSLSRAGYNVRATDNAHTLLKWVEAGEGDVVLTDVHMEQEDIFNFIPDLKSARPDLPIIIMSANTSVMTALKSGKFGVFEYIPKPFDLTYLQSTIERSLEKGVKESVNPIGSKLAEIDAMIGKSSAMQPVFRGISDFMSGEIPVHISGDVGTGKNLTASLVHNSGSRKERPFVFFDDIETGPSLVEQVGSGDLFIDRLEELSAARQNMLLRALEKNEVRQIGEKFRTISTSNLSYSALSAANMLRPELISHLGGGNIHLPPLYERQEDISDLAVFFINENPNNEKKRKFSMGALKLLKSNIWMGNVRELKNVVRAISLQYSDALVSEAIVRNTLRNQQSKRSHLIGNTEVAEKLRNAGRALLLDATDTGDLDDETPYAKALAWIEKPLIEEALKITNGNNVKAAELLGIHRNTLRSKIKSLDVNIF